MLDTSKCRSTCAKLKHQHFLLARKVLPIHGSDHVFDLKSSTLDSPSDIEAILTFLVKPCRRLLLLSITYGHLVPWDFLGKLLLPLWTWGLTPSNLLNLRIFWFLFFVTLVLAISVIGLCFSLYRPLSLTPRIVVASELNPLGLINNYPS